MTVNKSWMLAGAVLLLPLPLTAAPRGDADGDGKLTIAEFQAIQKKRFMAADSNGDGKISLEEWKARPAAAKSNSDPAKFFQRNDANGDGFIDEAEMDALIKRRFSRLDRDADGAISEQERAAQKAKSSTKE